MCILQPQRALGRFFPGSDDEAAEVSLRWIFRPSRSVWLSSLPFACRARHARCVGNPGRVPRGATEIFDEGQVVELTLVICAANVTNRFNDAGGRT